MSMMLMAYERRRRVVVLQQPQFHQDVFPIVIVNNVFPGHVAQQRQLQDLSIVDVRRNVHEAFTEPQQGPEAPKGSLALTRRTTQQSSGMSTCPKVPPRACRNIPKGLKMMCPASWKGRLTKCMNDWAV